jgi:Secretion system C-terminal sorting domain
MQKVKYIFAFCFLVYVGQINAQFEFTVSTDKNTYNYGEDIIVICTLTNISDSTVTIWSGSWNSCQAEFEFNDYYSGDWTYCLPLEQELIFQPGASRKYYWTVKPDQYGLPDKDGTQRIVGRYFYNNFRDTTKINAPLFLGGQLDVGFPIENDSVVTLLKDSLNIVVLNRIVYPNSDVINETWQEYGIQIDTLYNKLINDSRLDWVQYNRWIFGDSIVVTSVNDLKTPTVNNYYLENAYPNPFNPTTTIEFRIAHSGLVTLKVYDILGREVATLVNEEKQLGTYKVNFNGSKLSSGICFYRIQAGNFVQTKKMILLK